jgi:carbon monoxide dehydrogenase subunit G
MTDYQRTVEVAAGPDAAFSFLADPHNLPRYVATLTKAEPNPDGTLRVAADVQGRHEEGDALLQIDANDRRMHWSAPGDNQYTGTLQVSPAPAGSTITVHVHLGRNQDETEINRVLDQTQANIQQQLTNA